MPSSEQPTISCPNEHLVDHREMIATDRNGNCLDCGRRISKRPALNHRKGIYRAQLDYSGRVE